MMQILNRKLNEHSDILTETEAAILLLDCLVSYYKVCEDMFSNIGKSFSFPFSIKEAVEAKRSVVSFEMFLQIRQKAVDLRI